MPYVLPPTQNSRLGKTHVHKLSAVATLLLGLALSGVTNCLAQSSALTALGDISQGDLSKLESIMAPGTIPEHAIHPCDAFPPEKLISVFGEEARAATVARGHIQNDTFCTYKWPNPRDPQAHEALVQAAFMEAMTGGGDRSAKMAKLISLSKQAEFELSISFNYGGHFDNDAEAVAGLDRMVAQLTKGVGDESFSYSANFEPSENIGNKAVWSSKLRQLSVVSGTFLYHVRLQRQADAAADRENAEWVGRIVAETL